MMRRASLLPIAVLGAAALVVRAADAPKAADPKAAKAAGKAEGKSTAKPLSADGRKNLIANGGFEQGGKSGPAGWQRPDGLTSFWESAPGRKGKCIRIDTDVPNAQFRKREDEMEKAKEEKREPGPAPKKGPTSRDKYETVGGNDGVHFGCDRLPIDPAKHYLLEADCRMQGSGSPKVWVKLYGPARGKDLTRVRVLWDKALVMEGAGKEWKTFRMVFPLDTKIPAAVNAACIYLYPYWPATTYWFDDVRLVEITREEADAFAEEKGLLRRGQAK